MENENMEGTYPFDDYNQLLNNPTDSPDDYQYLAASLIEAGCFAEALYCYRKVQELTPNDVAANVNVEKLCESRIDRNYIMQLNNSERNAAFKEAIDKAVKSGNRRVLNFNSGFGLLSLMAVESGATKVTACENNLIVSNISRELAVYRGAQQKIDVLFQNSNDSTSLADFINNINDGSYLLIVEPENLIENFKDFLESIQGFSKPLTSGSKIMPVGITGYISLVECRQIRSEVKTVCEYEKHGSRNRIYFKIDMDEKFKNYSDSHISERLDFLRHGFKRLSDPVKVFFIDFRCAEDLSKFNLGDINREFKLDCKDPGVFDAILFEYDTHVDDDIVLSSSVKNEKVAFYPVQFNCIAHDIHLKPKDQVNVNLLTKKSHLDFEIRSIDQMKTTGCVLDIREMTESGYRFHKRDTSAESYHAMFRVWEPLVIKKFNDEPYQNVFKTFCRDYSGKSVLLIGNNMDPETLHFGMTGVFKWISVYSDNSEHDTFVESMFSEEYEDEDKSKTPLDRMSFYSALYDDEEFPEKGEKWDAVFVDFVGTNGMLNENLPEMSRILHRVLRPTNGTKVFPNRLRIVGYLVESEDLQSRNLVFEEGTAGVDIHECVNKHWVRQVSNLELSTLKRKRLSKKLVLMEFDKLDGIKWPCHLDSTKGLDRTETSYFSIIASGEAHAVVFWFEMDFDFVESVEMLDTSKLESRYKQAAILLDEDEAVAVGERYEVKTVVVGTSIIDITVDFHGSVHAYSDTDF